MTYVHIYNKGNEIVAYIHEMSSVISNCLNVWNADTEQLGVLSCTYGQKEGEVKKLAVPKPAGSLI